MHFSGISAPTLIEPGVKYFLNESLKQCRILKDKYYNTIFNIGLCAVFFTILGGLLIYKYKGKLSKEERIEKDKQKQQYILSKIANYQSAKKREQQELITGLPHWDHEYDIVRRQARQTN